MYLLSTNNINRLESHVYPNLNWVILNSTIYHYVSIEAQLNYSISEHIWENKIVPGKGEKTKQKKHTKKN